MAHAFPLYESGTVERTACVVVVGASVDAVAGLKEVDVGATKVVDAALLEIDVSGELELG